MDDPIEKRLEEVYACGTLHATEPVRAFDNLYDFLDGLLLDGYASVVDRMFGELDVQRLPVSMLLGILTLTKGWLRALPNRRGLFSRIEERLEREEGTPKAAELLRGLSP